MTQLVTSAPAPVAWTMRTPAGSVAEYAVTMALQNGNPYPVNGASWEYVVRASDSSLGEPLLTVTTTASASGVISVSQSPATVITLTLYPAATSGLCGTYRHALWMNNGTDGAMAWFFGSLVATPAPLP
jgi:hypothetical protein